MTLLIKHKFVSEKPDAADTSIVRPSNWNDSHEFTGILDIANGGTGAASLGGVKTAIGLGNVDNTSDANKPISTATQAALDLKANLSQIVGNNLIINGDFQINQRNFAGGALGSGVYGWDRWRGSCTATLSGYTVTLSSGSLIQIIEPAAWGVANFASTPITVSIDSPSADLLVSLGSASGTISTGAGRRSVTLVPAAGDTGNLSMSISKATAGSVTLGRVKASLSPLDTAWAPRPATLEMHLCWRYFYSMPGSLFIDGYDSGPNAYYYCHFPLPVAMRATPTAAGTITSSGNLFSSAPGAVSAPSNGVGSLNIRGAAIGRMYAFFEGITFSAEL